MEIHKPKPWHGFREFLKEYLIIVVGVLTALGGEQTVEWLHRRGEIAETRKVVHSEIALNAGFSELHLELERCFAARVGQFVSWADGGPHPPVVAGLSQPKLRTSNWETIKSSNVAHMPLEERLGYGYFYNDVEIANGNMDAEIALWPKLQGMAAARERPSPADAEVIRENAQLIRSLSLIRVESAENIIAQAKTMGIAPAPAPDRFVNSLRKLCTAAGLQSRI